MKNHFKSKCLIVTSIIIGIFSSIYGMEDGTSTNPVHKGGLNLVIEAPGVTNFKTSLVVTTLTADRQPKEIFSTAYINNRLAILESQQTIWNTVEGLKKGSFDTNYRVALRHLEHLKSLMKSNNKEKKGYLIQISESDANEGISAQFNTLIENLKEEAPDSSDSIATHLFKGNPNRLSLRYARDHKNIGRFLKEFYPKMNKHFKDNSGIYEKPIKNKRKLPSFSHEELSPLLLETFLDSQELPENIKYFNYKIIKEAQETLQGNHWWMAFKKSWVSHIWIAAAGIQYTLFHYDAFATFIKSKAALSAMVTTNILLFAAGAWNIRAQKDVFDKNVDYISQIYSAMKNQFLAEDGTKS